MHTGGGGGGGGGVVSIVLSHFAVHEMTNFGHHSGVLRLPTPIQQAEQLTQLEQFANIYLVLN